MATALTQTLIDRNFQNWIKGALAIRFAKEGLTEFVHNEIIQCQHDLIQYVILQKGLNSGSTCNSCSTANVQACPTTGFCRKGRCNVHNVNVPDKNPKQLCPNGLCNGLRDAIRNEHRYKEPSWKNTDAKKWCTDAIEICKCFMPPDGYFNKRSLNETDFNGTLAVVINCKRFQMKMKADLSKEPNVCTEAREVGRAIRHSASHTVSDNDLAKYIDDLITLLCDPLVLANDPKAGDAVRNLRQLKTNTLTIHADDITEVLKEYIQETFSDKQIECLQAIQDHFTKGQAESVSEIDDIMTRKINEWKEDITHHYDKKIIDIEQRSRSVHEHIEKREKELLKVTNTAVSKIKEIEEYKNKAKKEITEHTDEMKQGIQKIGQSLEENIEKNRVDLLKERQKHEPPEDDRANIYSRFRKKRLMKGLKKKLINYYDEFESTIPVSPLVEEHSVPLAQLYVKPKIKATGHLNPFTPRQEHLENQQCLGYKQLFYQDENEVNKNIYLSADAGIGKTSFARCLTVTWCQAHRDNKSLYQTLSAEDVKVMKTFKFLFLLHLRDFQCDLSCKIMEMIENFISVRIHKGRKYVSIIDNILNKKRCLIILDGIDEWSHPENPCPRKEEDKPHRNNSEKCTVLTTSRPWKVSALNLRPHESDLHVRICEFDTATSRELDNKAFLAINKNAKGQKDITDFENIVSGLISHLAHIPYIRLQLICLWFDGKFIGNSKCEMYSNIIELTLERGMKKQELGSPYSSSDSHFSIPVCMNSSESCKKNIHALFFLGKLALSSLLDANKESSLVINKIKAAKLLTLQIIEFSLQLGLLTQNKQYDILSEKQLNVSFQHKTMQEFFAALYISLDLSAAMEVVLAVITSLSDILEISNVLTFVSGLNPTAFLSMFKELRKIVARDKTVRDYRTSYTVCHNNCEAMLSYQSMLIACFEEHSKSGFGKWQDSLEDVLLIKDKLKFDDLKALSEMLVYTKENVKSLLIQYLEEYEMSLFSQNLAQKGHWSLEKLILEIKLEPDFIATILSESCNTLQFLYLKCLPISTSIAPLEKLWNLQGLFLEDIDISNENLTRFLKTITLNTLIRQLSMIRIKCIQNVPIGCQQHLSSDHGFILDLSNMHQLQNLHLENLPLSEVQVNTKELLECQISSLKNIQLKTVQNLYSNLNNSIMLRQLRLSRIHCLEQSTGSVSLNLSQHNKIESLNLQKISVNELYLNTESLYVCNVSDINSLTHNNIQEIYHDLKKSSKLRELHLRHIHCSVHETLCNGVTLEVHQLEQLQILHLSEIHSLTHIDITRLHSQLKTLTILKTIIMKTINCLDHKRHCSNITLDISQLRQLHILQLRNIPVCEFYINIECLEVCIIGYLDSVKRKSIQKLYADLRKASSMKQLNLKNLSYSEDDFNSPRETLDLSQLDKIQTITLHNIPLYTVRINTNCLEKCFIDVRINHYKIIRGLHTDLQKGPFLSQLQLAGINWNSLFTIGNYNYHVRSWNFSQLNLVKKIDMQFMHVKEIDVSTDNLEEFHLSNIRFMNSSGMNKLYSVLGRGKKIREFFISYLDFLINDGDAAITLDWFNNNQLQKLHLECISLHELRVSAECLTMCDFSDLTWLKHSGTQQFFTKLSNFRSLTCLGLKKIVCTEHEANCCLVNLQLVPLKHLQEVKVNIIPDCDSIQLNTECLEMCEFSNIKLSSHDSLKLFFTQLGSAEPLKELRLKTIFCREHELSCSDVTLQLPKLKQLRKLKVSNIPVCDLQVNIESIDECDYSDLNDLNHICVQKLFSELVNAKSLRKLRLNTIRCSEHGSNCGEVTLSFSELEHLRTLIVINIPVFKLQLNIDIIEECVFSDLSLIKHEKIQELFTEIRRAQSLRHLDLNNIICSEHQSDTCSCVALQLSQHRNIQMLKVSRIPVSEFQVNMDSLQNCDISYLDFGTKTDINKFYAMVGRLILLKNLRLCNLCVYGKSSVDVKLNISHLSRLKKLCLETIYFDELVVNTVCLEECEVLFDHVLTQDALKQLEQLYSDLKSRKSRLTWNSNYRLKKGYNCVLSFRAKDL